MTRRALEYLKTNFDDAAIVSALGHYVATSDGLSEDELCVLAAFQRANPKYADSDYEEIREYLSSLDEAQLMGLTANVKGILHEMEFVRIENEDGDAIHAAMFEATNHPGYDVTLFDLETGLASEIQLKATDDSAAVERWIESHPDGEIYVTSELAEKIDLQSSGLSNEELAIDVKTFVDKMLEGDSSLWDYVPGLGLLSVSLVVAELWSRKEKGEITDAEFRRLSAQSSGLKIGKMVGLVAALSVPVLGQVVGAALIARLLINAKSAVLG